MDTQQDGRSPAAPGRAATASQPSPSVSGIAGIPNAVDLVSSADALLHPTTGAMRGLFGDDPESKLLRIRVAELRRFDAFVRQARALASGIVAATAGETRQGLDERSEQSPVAKPDAQGEQP
jgi:hypothetical protein